jgi:hypothetical protein
MNWYDNYQTRESFYAMVRQTVERLVKEGIIFNEFGPIKADGSSGFEPILKPILIDGQIALRADCKRGERYAYGSRLIDVPLIEETGIFLYNDEVRKGYGLFFLFPDQGRRGSEAEIQRIIGSILRNPIVPATVPNDDSGPWFHGVKGLAPNPAIRESAPAVHHIDEGPFRFVVPDSWWRYGADEVLAFQNSRQEYYGLGFDSEDGKAQPTIRELPLTQIAVFSSLDGNAQVVALVLRQDNARRGSPQDMLERSIASLKSRQRQFPKSHTRLQNFGNTTAVRTDLVWFNGGVTTAIGFQLPAEPTLLGLLIAKEPSTYGRHADELNGIVQSLTLKE